MKRNIWDQIKNITAKDLIKALNNDKNWDLDVIKGAEHIFITKDKRRRVSIHFQPGKTYGPKLLKKLLSDIGWTEVDMRRLKLIK